MTAGEGLTMLTRLAVFLENTGARMERRNKAAGQSLKEINETVLNLRKAFSTPETDLHFHELHKRINALVSYWVGNEDTGKRLLKRANYLSGVIAEGGEFRALLSGKNKSRNKK